MSGAKAIGFLNNRLKLIISIAVALLVYILVLKIILRPATSILIAWNSGAICFLILIFLMILQATPERMRLLAKRQYQKRWALMTFVICSACSSLLAIIYMLADTKGLSEFFKTLHVILAGVTVISSWVLIHTTFALRYAHMYYYGHENSTNLSNQAITSLDFPDEEQPDYWDFLYFSFVIGMTCQVSDVPVRSRSMRRLTLVHSILTFFFNTIILALSINIIAGLI
ncbi:MULTISPECIES: DUF1345 domain-containing protein [Nostocales]|uniref:DUF1345 domain-containing protein n=3 Tax=Nostocales TaxID=1161 RepID=A0A0C1N3P2_9CYAN|nr:DUF1345 domain-containing protein [Tolypothrix bouteillei]KAF3891238.1 DUF1345 domain-containing protein [Tolypothrix bouteillei VB521301]